MVNEARETDELGSSGRQRENPGAKGYTKREARAMIDGLKNVRIEKTATRYDARYAGGLAGLTGRQLGFFTVIRGVKQR
ncbi:MAG: hypothetical protein WAU42_03025 [Solirubrobacteraceae bacterium]